MARPSSPNANYPEINEYFDDFDYSRLTVPPPDWELYDIPDKTHLRNRALDLQTFKKLVKHHAWGFNVVIEERKTKENLLQVLKRIIYNHDASRRPNWHQFVSRDCDSGPRLLRQSLNAPQFSRRMPMGDPEWKCALPMEMPPASATAQPNPNAREGRPLPDDTSFLTQAQDPLWPTPPQDTITPLNHQTTASFTSYQNPMASQYRTISGSSPGHGATNGFSKSTRTETQEHATYPLRHQAPQDTGTVTRPPPAPSQSRLNSLLRRSVSRCAYGLLDSPLPNKIPSAQIPFSRPSATGPIIGATTFSHLRLRVSDDQTQLSFDERGALYTFRCRGPLSPDGTSSIFDCVVVAGLMTHAGSTTIDKTASHKSAQTFTPYENAFIQAMNDCSNDILTDDKVSTVKGRLWSAYTEYYQPDPQFAHSSVMDPARVWAAFTRPFAQFQLGYTDNYTPCGSHGGTIESVTCQKTVASVDYHLNDNEGVEITTILQRFFQGGAAVNCAKCGSSCSRKRERTFESTPLRLVIRPHSQSKILNTCVSPIKVQFTNTNGEMVNEEYIFIGGIFRSEKNGAAHYRLCWKDNDHGTGGGHFRLFYDASQISGMIPGGIRLRKPDEIAPSTWWAGGYPALLFFEKIIHPTKDLILRDQKFVCAPKLVNGQGYSRNGTPNPVHLAKNDYSPRDKRRPSRMRQPATLSNAPSQSTKPPTPSGSTQGQPDYTSSLNTRASNSIQSATYIPARSNGLINNTCHENAQQTTQSPFKLPTSNTTFNSNHHTNENSKAMVASSRPTNGHQEVHNPPPMPTSGSFTNPRSHMNGSSQPANEYQEAHNPPPMLTSSSSTSPHYYINGSNQSANGYQKVHNPPLIPTSGSSTNPHSHMNGKLNSVPARDHQDNSRLQYYNQAMTTFNTPIDRQVPNGYGPRLAESCQADADDGGYSPYTMPTLDTPTGAQQSINHRLSSVPESNCQADAYQATRYPSIIEIPSSTPSPTSFETKPAMVRNPQAADMHEEVHCPPPIHPADVLSNPSFPPNTNGRIDTQPPIPTDTQAMGAENIDVLSNSMEGLAPADFEATSWALEDFIHNNSTLFSSTLQGPNDASPAMPQPTDGFPDPGAQADDTGLGPPVAPEMASFMTDEAWLSQWNVNGAASSSREVSLAGSTFQGAPMVTSASSSNNLKRKSSGGNGEWSQVSGIYGEQLKRRG